MLNLERKEQALTQGQSQGRRVVARAVQVEEATVQSEEPVQGPSGAAALPASGPAAGIDAQAVARQVYELMRQDLRVEHERRRPGG